jgi:non-ribosomal peptide synthase protein (TIGR01720 family)
VIRPEPIAVTGIGCRFPGADGPEALWRVLLEGVDCITEVPPARWDAAAFYDPDPDAPGRTSTRYGGFIDGLERFDPAFFGISDREVPDIDPQQRLLLEVTWHALEDAGLTRARLAGSRTGVFIGISHSDYARELAGPSDFGAHTATGAALSIAANRISFSLDLRGPSLAIDTACSSSLVAVHMALQSLALGECDTAIVGGVNVILTPDLTIGLSKAGMMAPDGRCKTFDAAADGYVRGEGAGVIVLERLSAAREHGDRVLAIVRGSAVNQDGRSNGINAPNPAAQEDVIRRALERAGTSPADVAYVEVHGTGTLLGDPIEARSLGAVLAAGRGGTRCAVGSIKGNIGHLEAAAGVAGMIKVVLALHHGVIPPSLHFRNPNPYIPFDALPLHVQTECGPWPEGGAVAGISSFGFGGTNCHVILERAQEDPPPVTVRGAQLLTISAQSRGSLAALAAQYEALLADAHSPAATERLCLASNARRTPMRHRIAMTGRDAGELRARLRETIETQEWTAVRNVPPRVAMFFPGGDARPELLASALSLARLWRSRGIEPELVSGQGRGGELAAACVAGACTEEEALALARAAAQEWDEVAAAIDWKPLRIPMISGVTGEQHDRVDAAYWRMAEARRSWQWSGPPRHFEGKGGEAAIWIDCGLGGGDALAFAEAEARLFLAGAPLAFRGAAAPLPRYPFEPRVFPIHRHQAAAVPQPALAARPEPASAPGATGSILTRLRETVAAALGTSADNVPDDALFLEMGGDSIILLDAVHRIEREFHVSIPLRAFFDELSTVARLAAFLEGSGAGAAQSEHAGGVAVESVSAQPRSPSGSIIWGQREVRARRLAERQQAHLDDLTARFTARTRGSKELARRHRRALADSRAAAGFRFTTKEMLYPIAGAGARGARLWDIDGNEYVDLTMGFGVHLFGHEPEFIAEALRAQLDEGVQLGPQARIAGETAELICRITGHERAALCTTGTEAVMLALRIARAVRGKTRVVVFSGSYHGHSDGVLAEATGRPTVAGVTPNAVGDVLVLDYGSDEALRIIEENAAELAAVLVEPVQSRRPDLQPREFLQRLRGITRDHGVALIFDELITGFRIAAGGAQEHFGVHADLATYGKIIGGGMPIGCVAGAAAWMDAVDGGWWEYGDASYPAAETTFFASTFSKHPLTLAAARAVLREVERRGPALYRELNARTAALAARLQRELAETPFRVVRFGSLFRFAFSGNQDLFFHHLVEKGLYVWEGRNCFISTAHTDADLDAVVDVVRRSVAELREAGFFGAVLPLSDAQSQLATLASISDEGSAAYHIPLLLETGGDIDAERLRSAFAAVIARHEALRLQIDPGQRTQRVAEAPPFAMSLEDVAEDEVMERVASRLRRPFDFSRPLLPRVALYRTPARTLLQLVFHHITVDGLSVQLVLAEVAALYDGAELPPAPRFSDWLHWQETQLASAAWDAQRDFWIRALTPLPPPLEVPADRVPPAVRSYAGRRVALPLDGTALEAIRTLASSHHCTPFMVCLAAWAMVLQRTAGADDFTIGIPVAGRGMRGSESLAGYCTHLLPVRFDFLRGRDLGAVLATLRARLFDAFEHADYPFARLRAELGAPLVSHTFNVDRVAALPRLGGADVRLLPPPVSHAKFDLGMNVLLGDSSAVAELDFDADRFAPSTAARLLERFARLLSSHEMLSPQEAEQVARWNRPSAERGFVPLHARIAHHARTTPDALAVICGGQSLSYGALDAKADALASRLVRGTRVVLLLPRGLDLVVAIVAALKAGAAYVPLEPDTPPERLAMLLDAIDAAGIVTPSGFEPRGGNARDEELAYVLFTSGSTGTPKPVGVLHAAIASYTDAVIERLALSRGHYAMVSTVAADLGNTMLFPALALGGTLHLISNDVARDPEAMAAAMRGIDCLKIVPSHLEALVAEVGAAPLMPRTHLILGGERASESLLDTLAAAQGSTRIINHYGPTEATVGVMTGELRNGDGARFAFEAPLANARILLLDVHGDEVPPGSMGEICIGGPCLAAGYLGMPEMTAERFITRNGERLYRTGDRARLLADGRLDLLGRIDDQLKIRGHRVEPGEVAAVLQRCEGAGAVYAGAVRTGPGTQALVAWTTGGALESELLAFARRHLPEAMVPWRCVQLDALPLNANGKVDRSRLPLPELPASRADAAAGVFAEAEAALAEIWRDVLRCAAIAPDDNFFALGGDSILSIQVGSRARRAGLHVDPRDIYRHPTLRALAATAGHRNTTAPVAEQARPEGDVPLVPSQRWFFEQDVPNRSHWNMSVLLELDDRITLEMLQAAFEAIVRHHDAFRLCFREDGGWTQSYGEAPAVTIETIEDRPAELDRIQQSLDISRGETLRVACIDTAPRRLLMVIHHLIVDGVSWRILIEDLQTALAQLGRGEPADLGPKSASWQAWAEQLTRYDAGAEEELWLAGAEVPGPPARPRAPESSTRTLTLTLDAETTALLLHRPGRPQPRGAVGAPLTEPVAEVRDLLLAALLEAAGETELLVEMEAHGREPLFERTDVSRTVGWFTARYPLWLLRDAGETGGLIRSVKEQLRSVPHQGIGYGVLRSYGADDVQRALRNHAAPFLTFNYLGQFDHLLADGAPLRLVDGPRGMERDPRAARWEALALDVFVSNGRLSTTWIWSAAVHEASYVERLAQAYCAALRSVIAHCTASSEPAYTPSDFGAAGLAQRELDEVVARVRA